MKFLLRPALFLAAAASLLAAPDDGPAFAIGGNATIEKLAVHPLADIWK